MARVALLAANEERLEERDTEQPLLLSDRAGLASGGASQQPQGKADACTVALDVKETTTVDDWQLDIVQFSAPIYYVARAEGVLSIDVIRIGSLQGPCSVKFSTQDGTATAGDDYEAHSQVVEFADGEDAQTVEIRIIEKCRFETTEEMIVVASDPLNCKLGLFLHTARVKVQGRGYFPTEKYADQLAKGKKGLDEINQWSLYFEFLRWVWRTEGLAWRTALTMLIDQLPNLYKWVCLEMSLYLVDFLFKEDVTPLITSGPHNGRVYTGYAIAVMYLLPPVVIHFANIAKEHLDSEGAIECTLQVHMIRKYLNYTDKSRKDMAHTKLERLLVQKTEAAAGTYSMALQILQLLGHLLVLSVFQFIKDSHAFLASSSMPLLMFLFATVRAPALKKAKSAASRAQMDLSREVHRTAQHFSTIQAYQRRPVAEESVFEQARTHRRQSNDLAVVHANNEFLGHILGPLLIFLHILLRTESVIVGDMTLGAFLTTIAVFQTLSTIYTDAYRTAMALSAAHGSIRHVAHALNLPIDLEERKQVNRKRRSSTQRMRTEIRASRKITGVDTKNLQPVTDLVPIQLDNMCYNLPERVLFRDVNVTLTPGGIVAIWGEQGCGKSTLMQLLANILFPSKGSVFVPSHLRTLYVEQQPTVMELSAWDNLTYGHAQASPQRVMEILSDLKMDYVHQVVRQELQAAGRLGELSGDHARQSRLVAISASWQDELSRAEAAKIHLARAFIMSPEVLIMQRPLGNFSFAERATIMDMMKAFVSNRGVRLPQDSVGQRRPRSLLFSPTFREDLLEADVIWTISGGGVVSRDTATMADSDLKSLFEGSTSLISEPLIDFEVLRGII